MAEGQKKLISNYEVTETILEAADGILYKAVDTSSANPVLIKIYFPSLNWSDALLNEFFDRFSYLRFIEHDNLLPILDMGKYENAPYVVYPYLTSSFFLDLDLQKWKEKDILGTFGEIADALDFLHKQEIIHGILGTDNILVDATGHPKLFDYGLIEIFRKLLLENTEEGFHNLSIAKVETTSPEQLKGHPPTKQSDIYSFGILLFFVIFGKYPFRSKLVPEIATWHVDPGVTLFSLESPRGSIHILQFIQKCIQITPEKRFINFVEVLKVLERAKKRKRTRLSFQKRIKLVKTTHPRRLWWYLLPTSVIFALAAWFLSSLSTVQKPPLEVTSTPTSSTVPTKAAVTISTLAPTESPTDPIEMTQEVSVQAAAYRPAIEGQPADVLTEKITTSNALTVREISRLGNARPEDGDISSSGRYFAIATSAGVFIYKGIQQETWIDPQGWATAVQFSPDENLLAIGLESGEIQLWDWANGVHTSNLSGHSGKISRIIFSSNSRYIYSASFDQHVIVWNAASQSIVQDIAAHSDPINDIAVSSDGRTLATCSDDQLVRVWDLAAGTKTYELRYPGKLKALALSSDDVYLAVGGEAGLIWQTNIRTRQLRTDPIPVTERVWSLEYFDQDKQLLAGTDSGKHETYDASQLRYQGVSLDFKITPLSLPLVKIFGFDFTFDSYTTFSGKPNEVLTLRWDGTVNYGNVQVLEPFYDSQDRLDFSQDGKVLAASGKRGITSIWNLDSNQILYRKYGARLPLGDPIAPNGKFAVLEMPSTYRVINLSNNADSRDLSEKIQEGVISYADEGSILISANLKESKVWDYESGYETLFDSHPENGCLITASANNQEILQVNSAAGVVPIWHDETKRFCAKSFSYVNSISALSTNMQLFVYRSSNGFIEGFDPVKNQLLWKYPSQGKPDSKITALAVSSNGSIVAIGDESGKLLLLDGTEGQLLAELTGNFGAVQAIEFSSNDLKLATTGFDGMIRIFGVSE